MVIQNDIDEYGICKVLLVIHCGPCVCFSLADSHCFEDVFYR